MAARFLIGDVLAQVATLDDDSVDLVLTSPPFLALRSYLPADHPDKHLEGGSQATPGEFIDWLVDVVEALDRVLAPHGSMCIELGDTYSGGKAETGAVDRPQDGGYDKGDRVQYDGQRAGIRNMNDKIQPGGEAGPLAKSLSLIPELFRLTLVYGTNPLTGRETEPWRLRNVVRWVRPNPPVGALGDKFRPATSELMVFCKSVKRFFDLDAVREALTERAARESELGGVSGGESYQGEASDGTGYNGERLRQPATGEGAPPLDWWQIPTHPYKGAHYATWPPALCVKPIKAMSPERVCLVCGEPSRRIVEPSAAYVADQLPTDDPWRSGKAPNNIGQSSIKRGATTASFDTVGWSDCGHNNWRPGHVLDPFAGTGTVLAVATGHGRDATGIDLDPRNADLALDRVGPLMLTVEP